MKTPKRLIAVITLVFVAVPCICFFGWSWLVYSLGYKPLLLMHRTAYTVALALSIVGFTCVLVWGVLRFHPFARWAAIVIFLAPIGMAVFSPITESRFSSPAEMRFWRAILCIPFACAIWYLLSPSYRKARAEREAPDDAAGTPEE